MVRPATEEMKAQVEQIGWYHSIDFGNGLATHGLGDSPVLHSPGAVPSVAGRTVLDIGAWDGGWSFWAEQQGATRVVALDHYVWKLDWAKRNAYWEDCAREGRFPDHDRDEVDFWHAEGTPGRRGFDLAHSILESNVEPLVADFMKVDLDQVGTFDVVLYFGVLYHMREPLVALQRLRKVTREVAAIETEAIDTPGHTSDGLLKFFAGDELNRDFGNWYAPNETALHGMCRAAGFRRVETLVGPPSGSSPDVASTAGPISNYRLVVHAYP